MDAHQDLPYAGSQSIFSAAADCCAKLEQCAIHPALNQDHWGRNRLADFRLWNASVGATAKIHMSLDVRLENDDSAKNFVIAILSTLSAWAKKCLDLADSFQPQTSSPPSNSVPTLSAQGEVNETELKAASFTPCDTEDDEPDITLMEAENSVRELLHTLVLVGLVIRRAGTASRYREADRTFESDFKSNGNEYENLKGHLEFRLRLPFLSKERETSKSFSVEEHSKMIELRPEQQILLMATLKRRHRIRVAQAREPKLRDRHLRQIEESVTPCQIVSSRLATPRVTISKATDGGSQDTLEYEHPKTHAYSSVSKPSDYAASRPLEQQIQVQNEGVAATTMALRADYPKLPTASGGEQVSRCPYCCLTFPIEMLKTNSHWRKHVSEDIQPYNCFLQNCPMQNPYFDTLDAWKLHMQWELRELQSVKYWKCFACKTRFEDESSLSNHMKDTHTDIISLDHLPAICQMCLTYDSKELTICPVCSINRKDWEKRDRRVQDSLIKFFIDHIGQCLHDFSLRSLPEDAAGDQTYGPDTNDANQDISNQSSRSYPSVSLKFFDGPDHENGNDLTLQRLSDENDNYLTQQRLGDVPQYYKSQREYCQAWLRSSDEMVYEYTKEQTEKDNERQSLSTIPMSHAEYTVGWICALPKEQTAATAVLDRIHPELDKPISDHNAYTLGSIGEHNIVIACLPMGQIGTNQAATVATRMVNTFPSIRVGFMVGIGGGIPPNVRLGDVVVSTPTDGCPGVVQWDLGKAEGGNFKRTGALNNPPSALLTALTKLRTRHEMSEPKIRQYLDVVKEKWPRLAPKYTSSETLKDPLSAPVTNQGGRRDMCIHYGLIASGNQVIKDEKLRDELNDSLDGDVLCVEMEAAGLMNDFPCIVIRGICDYADAHKNKDWQEYAATVAAACAKELLEYVQPAAIRSERSVGSLLGQNTDRSKESEILNWITPIDYASEQSDVISRRQQGTGQWLLNSTEYEAWLSTRAQTLFCTGIPGAGKTVITSIVIENLIARADKDQKIGVAYIYCNFKRSEEQNVSNLLKSLLRQLAKGRSIPPCVRDLYNRYTEKGGHPSLDDIQTTLKSVSGLYSRVFIVIDALDEYQTSVDCQSELLSSIFNFQAHAGVNLFATSRHVSNIEQKFQTCPRKEIIANDDDIRKYLDNHISGLPEFVFEEPDLPEKIKNGIIKSAEGMFLLAYLHLRSLHCKTSRRQIDEALKGFEKRRRDATGNTSERGNLDETLSKAYDDVMERINGQAGEFKQ